MLLFIYMAARKIAVSFILKYFRFWAHVALAVHRPTVIGIAGSTGKTSTKQILLAMLLCHANTKATYGNSETGVPLGILGLTARYGAIGWITNMLLAPLRIFHLRGTKYLIVEMGTDEPNWPKNMDYLLTIVQPDLAIHLNAQPVHTQQFAAALTPDQKQLPPDQQQPYIVRAIGQEDAKIITATQADPAIINGDDPILRDIYLPFMANKGSRDVLTYGQSKDDQLVFQTYQTTADGTSFSFLLNNQLVTIALPGYILPHHYQQSIGAALLATSSLGLDIATTAQNFVNHLHLPKGRSSIVPGINNTAIIDSTYNASTAAVLDMLSMLKNLKQQTGRPAVVLLGDMRELGDQAGVEHQRIKNELTDIDAIYAVGPLTKQYIIDPLHQQPEPPNNVRWFESSVEAGTYLKEHLPENALLLAKGSQNTIYLEEAIKLLLADPADASKLCRQDKDWLKRKKVSS